MQSYKGIKGVIVDISKGSSNVINDLINDPATISNLRQGYNSIPITNNDVKTLLNTALPGDKFPLSLKLVYDNNVTSNPIQGSSFAPIPPRSRYGWKKGTKYGLIPPKLSSPLAHTIVSTTPTFTLPNLYNIPVYNQGQLGSCSANALAFVFEYCQQSQSLPMMTPPSRLFIYYNERNIEGTTATDSGAEIYDGISSLNTYGVCSETLWPYDISQYTVSPPSSCYKEAAQNLSISYNAVSLSVLEIKAALVSGNPVIFGFQVFSFFESAQMTPIGILELPATPTDMTTYVGGHAVVMVGYDDTIITSNGTGAFLVRNSWGTDSETYWGFNYTGYFWMPYEYVTGTYTDSNGNQQPLVSDLWTINLVSRNNLTFGGTYGSGLGEFNSIGGIAVDGFGNYVVSDTFNNRVQVFSPSGEFITTFGSQGSANGQFSQPFGIAIDNARNYVVSDTFNNRVQVFSSYGNYLNQIGSYGSANGQFVAPYGVAVDLNGNYVIADSGNNRVQVITPSGIYVNQFSGGNIQFNNPRGIAIDLNGNYIVADTGNNIVQVITPSGIFVNQLGSSTSSNPGNGNGGLNNPCGVAVDKVGNYLVADANNNIIQIFSPLGAFLSELGSTSLTDNIGDSINGPFWTPKAVAVDSFGNYVIGDSGHNRVMIFDS
jgi:C1A family cysteine protease/DNA-binding beta-propeller fold protein YncE